MSKLYEQVPLNVAHQIIKVPIQNGIDAPLWKLSENGKFSLRQTWHQIRQCAAVSNLFKGIWGPLIKPSISMFLWRLIHGWVPVDNRLRRKGIELVSICPRCKNEEESVQHLFLHCHVARAVWEFFGCLFNINLPDTPGDYHHEFKRKIISGLWFQFSFCGIF